MLIPSFATPDPFYAQVISGVEDVLSRGQYALLLGQTYNELERQSQYLQAFRARLVDGILLFQNAGEDPELRKYLDQKEAGCPLWGGCRRKQAGMWRQPTSLLERGWGWSICLARDISGWRF